MTPADKLLDHFDRIAGSEAHFTRCSDEGVDLAVFAAIYRDFPEPGANTGFTVGLSHFHPPGGGHKELSISMRDSDDAWAFACGYLAFQLRERCRFACGDTINFHERIAKSSSMSAFVVVHPRHIAPADTVVDIGIRKIEIVQIVPIYEEEREWFSAGGNLKAFLQACPAGALLDPQRKAILPG